MDKHGSSFEGIITIYTSEKLVIINTKNQRIGLFKTLGILFFGKNAVKALKSFSVKIIAGRDIQNIWYQTENHGAEKSSRLSHVRNTIHYVEFQAHDDVIAMAYEPKVAKDAFIAIQVMKDSMLNQNYTAPRNNAINSPVTTKTVRKSVKDIEEIDEDTEEIDTSTSKPERAVKEKKAKVEQVKWLYFKTSFTKVIKYGLFPLAVLSIFLPLIAFATHTYDDGYGNTVLFPKADWYGGGFNFYEPLKNFSFYLMIAGIVSGLITTFIGISILRKSAGKVKLAFFFTFMTVAFALAIASIVYLGGSY